MEIKVRAAEQRDVDRIELLYGRLHDYLETHENHSRWKRGVYPTRAEAQEGFESGRLYLVEVEGEVAGSAIYLPGQDEVYEQVAWGRALASDRVYVIHVLVVDPAFFGRGVGKALLDYACALGRENGMGAVRLDVFEENFPAIRLYERSGFDYRGTIDLGLEEQYGLKWYRVYEKLL